MTALDRADQEPGLSGPQQRHDWLLWVRSSLAEASGSRGQALQLIWDAWQECASAGLASGCTLLAPDVVRLCLGAEDRARAEQVAAALEDLVPRARAPVVTAAALRCRGLLGGDTGALGEAAQTYEDAGRPFEAASAAEEAGTILARRPEKEGALGGPRRARGSVAALQRRWGPPTTSAASRPAYGTSACAGASKGHGDDPATDGLRLPTPNEPSPPWWRKGCPILKSPSGCSCPATRCTPTHHTSSPSSA